MENSSFCVEKTLKLFGFELDPNKNHKKIKKYTNHSNSSNNINKNKNNIEVEQKRKFLCEYCYKEFGILKH